jgi:hypothetical protein
VDGYDCDWIRLGIWKITFWWVGVKILICFLAICLIFILLMILNLYKVFLNNYHAYEYISYVNFLCRPRLINQIYPKMAFMSVNKLNILSSPSVFQRKFSTKVEYSLMDEITDISEWETKVVQSENLVGYLYAISICNCVIYSFQAIC